MATIRMLIVILAGALALPAHAQPALSLFEAVYTISFSVAKGEATVSLRTTGDGEYIYDSVTRAFLGFLYAATSVKPAALRCKMADLCLYTMNALTPSAQTNGICRSASTGARELLLPRLGNRGKKCH